jgi:hypothetical protein
VDAGRALRLAVQKKCCSLIWLVFGAAANYMPKASQSTMTEADALQSPAAASAAIAAAHLAPPSTVTRGPPPLALLPPNGFESSQNGDESASLARDVARALDDEAQALLPPPQPSSRRISISSSSRASSPPSLRLDGHTGRRVSLEKENAPSTVTNSALPANRSFSAVTISSKRQKTNNNSRRPTNTLGTSSTISKRKPSKPSKDSSSDLTLNRKALVNDNFIHFAREKHITLPKMSQQEKDEYKRDIERFENSFRTQCRHRFAYQKLSDDDFVASIGLGTRSVELVDDDAMEVSTSDRRRLSRYHMEDCLRLSVGQTVRLYFRKSAVNDPKMWWNKSCHLQAIIDLQQSEPFKMMGEEYYEVTATVSQAKMNHDVQMGYISSSQFETAYSGVGQGITVDYKMPDGDSRRFKLSIAWRYLIEYADSFFLWGPPLDRSRNYSTLLKGKRNLLTLGHIFFTIAKETIGDYGNSLCLLDAYQKVVNDQIIRDLTKAKQDTK